MPKQAPHLRPWILFPAEDTIPTEGDIFVVDDVESDEWDEANNCKVTLVALRPFRATIQPIKPIGILRGEYD